MMENERVALVTGGGRGIGRGIVLALANDGWKVGINYRGDTASARETLHLVEKAGTQGALIQGDIARSKEHERILEILMSQWGRLDLLVNNAGMAPRQRVDLLDMSEDSYDEVMSVNLKGPFFLTQRIAKSMIVLLQTGKIQNPVIINIGSISAYTVSLNRGEYCLSKAGMAMMTRLFADRLAEEHIGVYEIRPGIIATDMTSGVHEKYDSLISNGLTPIRRWGKPEDVARAVVALADGALPFSTGEVINVDGGVHIRRL